MGPVLGPHAHTNRARETRAAAPWLPAPMDGRPREGQRLSPQQGMQARVIVLGPHTRTPAPTARG